MVASSVLLSYGKKAFYQEHLKRALLFSIGAFALGVAFLFCQAWGWMEFFSLGFGFPTVNVASSYVYVISGLHFAHMIGGIFSLGFGFPTVNVASSYVYVISGLHFAHMIGGISALGLMIYQHSKVLGDPVKELIFFTNPFEKTKIDLVATYWHFTDVVWLVLFVYFLLTF